jgi:hypothetical protein
MIDSLFGFKGLDGPKRALPRNTAGFAAIFKPTPVEPAFLCVKTQNAPPEIRRGVMLVRYRASRCLSGFKARSSNPQAGSANKNALKQAKGR